MLVTAGGVILFHRFKKRTFLTRQRVDYCDPLRLAHAVGLEQGWKLVRIMCYGVLVG